VRDSSGRKKTILDYYREEQQYLDEAGREFARAYPQRARFLNITQRDDRDPYVERLFEGFAFLTGRIRQKLDDELPELTQSLLGLLWPHFLRPIPSLSILEFRTPPGRFKEPHTIERNTEVASQPVRRRHVCQFRTSYDVHIRPIALAEADLDGNSAIRFRFRVDDGVDYSKLFSEDGGATASDYQRRRRQSIRLFIHDVDQQTALILQLYLTRYVQKVVIQAAPEEPEVVIQGQAGVQSVGFAPEESLIPYATHSFSGYRLLQEYFAYPQKFLFFDLFGFDRLRPTEGTKEFEVRVSFDRPFPTDRRFSASNFRLQCTPIVNLLQTEAQPKTASHETTEYRIHAPESCEIYSVDEVEGIISSTMERRTYLPFYSFRHSLADDRGERLDRYYYPTTRLAVRRNDDGQPQTYQDTYLAIIGPDAEADDVREETLSLKITCTNGQWARELKEGDIVNPTSNSGIPEFIQFRNLTQPSVTLYPPLQSGLEWRFISHLALNYLSLDDVEALRGLLELYEWNTERGTREANHLRISGISNVSARPQDIIHRGSVIRGIDVTLEIVKENFADDGDIHLFGLVMREFIGLYASINSFTQLTLVSHDSKEELFRWTPEVMSDENRESLMKRKHLSL